MGIINIVIVTVCFIAASCSGSHFSGQNSNRTGPDDSFQQENGSIMPPVEDVSDVAGDVNIEVISPELPPKELSKASNPTREGDLLGYSVDISGNWLISGAWGDDDDDVDAGAAYFYRWEAAGDKETWVMKQKVTPASCGATQSEESHFGKMVAISSNFAVVGAPQDFDDSSDVNDDFMGNIGSSLIETSTQGIGLKGSIFVFKMDNAGVWNCFQEAIAPAGLANNDVFGISVDIFADPNLDPNTGLPINGVDIIVGAKGDDEGVGRAYLFHSDSMNVFSASGDMTAPLGDQQADAFFGESVAIHGNLAIVGAPLYDEQDGANLATQVGAAYVYQRDAAGVWSLKSKLAPNSVSADLHFGKSVDIQGGGSSVAVVGAYKSDEKGSDAGAAFVFRLANGVWAADLISPPTDLAARDHFGFAVAISGNTLMVGAPGDDHADQTSMTDVGSAYFYRYENGVWTMSYKMGKPSDLELGSQYSFSLAIDGLNAAIGVPFEDDSDGMNKGAITFINMATPVTQ